MRSILIVSLFSIGNQIATAATIGEIRNPTFCDSIFIPSFPKPRFTFNRDEHGRILLRMESTTENPKVILRDLLQWRKALGLDARKLDDAPMIASPFGPAYDVTEWIPEHMKSLHHTRAAFDGPNCWDFACYMTGAHSHRAGVQFHEFAFWLDSQNFRRLDDHEVPRPGDLIALRRKAHPDATKSSEVDERHGMVYISPRIALSKNDYSSDSKYEIVDINQTFRYTPAESISCLDPRFRADMRCDGVLEIYRFRDDAKMTEETKIALPVEIQQKRNELMTRGKRVEGYWIQGLKYSESEEKELSAYIEQEVGIAKRRIQELGQNPNLDDATRAKLQNDWVTHWARIVHLAPDSFTKPSMTPWDFGATALARLKKGIVPLDEFPKDLKQTSRIQGIYEEPLSWNLAGGEVSIKILTSQDSQTLKTLRVKNVLGWQVTGEGYRISEPYWSSELIDKVVHHNGSTDISNYHRDPKGLIEIRNRYFPEAHRMHEEGFKILGRLRFRGLIEVVPHPSESGAYLVHYLELAEPLKMRGQWLIVREQVEKVRSLSEVKFPITTQWYKESASTPLKPFFEPATRSSRTVSAEELKKVSSTAGELAHP